MVHLRYWENPRWWRRGSNFRVTGGERRQGSIIWPPETPSTDRKWAQFSSSDMNSDLLFLSFPADTHTHTQTKTEDTYREYVCVHTQMRTGRWKREAGANPAKMLTWVCSALNNRKTRVLSPHSACLCVLVLFSKVRTYVSVYGQFQSTPY